MPLLTPLRTLGRATIKNYRVRPEEERHGGQGDEEQDSRLNAIKINN